MEVNSNILFSQFFWQFGMSCCVRCTSICRAKDIHARV